MAAINTKSREPLKTGNRTNEIFAFIKTPRSATAPAGGCKQRSHCPREIVSPTANPMTIGVLPKRAMQHTLTSAAIVFPAMIFLGCARGLIGLPNSNTEEAPKGAAIKLSVVMWVSSPSAAIASSPPSKEVKICPLLNWGWSRRPACRSFLINNKSFLANLGIT